jgi:hypothetical protein
MSPEEVANAEALRRIHEAEHTGATALDLSDIDFLYQLPQELERLKSIQTVFLFRCKSRRIRSLSGRDGTQLPVLKKFLSGVLESVAAGNSYQEEEGLYE